MFAAEESYAIGLAVALHSALRHLSHAVDVKVAIFDSGLAQPSRLRLEEVARRARLGTAVCWIAVPPERLGHLAGTSLWADTSAEPTVYSRLLIAALLPQHITRAVYLDSDVLIQSDISPLFTLPLGGAPIAAVVDYVIGSNQHELPSAWERSHSRRYFNSGVLVVDVEQWRATALGDRTMTYAAEADHVLVFPDQDALNAVVDSWQELDYRWNVQPWALFMLRRQWRRWSQSLEALLGPSRAAALPPSDHTDCLHRQRWRIYRSAAVLHFIGPKPWSARCNTPGTMAWVSALMRSGWYTRSEALAWLLPWLCIRTSGRWLWLCRRALLRVADSNMIQAAHRHLRLPSLHSW